MPLVVSNLYASARARPGNQGRIGSMKIVILDDYQDAVRKLACAAKLEPYQAKVYTNTVKGLGQLSVRLKDAEVIVLNRERTHLPRALIEKPVSYTNLDVYKRQRGRRPRADAAVHPPVHRNSLQSSSQSQHVASRRH